MITCLKRIALSASLALYSFFIGGLDLAAQDHDSVRILRFPTTAIGSVFTTAKSCEESLVSIRNGSTRIANAIGEVKVRLKDTEYVLLDLNPQTILHPEILKEFSEDGIDRLKICYIPMEDVPSVCDRTLAFAPLFKKLVSIDVMKSDATDKGLLALKHCSNLKTIAAVLSEVNGDCFAELSSLPKFETLDVGMCRIKQSNLVSLSRFRSLKSLYINSTNLTPEGLEFISQCKQLTYLNLDKNSHIGDSEMSLVTRMKTLKVLVLTGTKVTLTGLRELKSLKLDKLRLPNSDYQPAQKTLLRQLFPSTALECNSFAVSRDTKKLYAPLRP